MTQQSTPAPAEPSALLDVAEVAHLLRCSPRHVYRLADRGEIPRPRRLGSLIRWVRADIERWLREGGSADGTR